MFQIFIRREGESEKHDHEDYIYEMLKKQKIPFATIDKTNNEFD